MRSDKRNFDPNKKKWLITNTKSIVVDIIKDNFKEAENLGFKKEEIEFLEKDIRFRCKEVAHGIYFDVSNSSSGGWSLKKQFLELPWGRTLL